MSQNIKIYSGISTTGDEIAAELGAVQQGSLYLATDGSLYHKYRATNDGNAWYRIAIGTPETEKKLLAVAQTLLANDYSAKVIKTKSVSQSLVPEMFKRFVRKTISVSQSLAVSFAALIKKTKSTSVTLTPVSSKFIKLQKGALITTACSYTAVDPF